MESRVLRVPELTTRWLASVVHLVHFYTAHHLSTYTNNNDEPRRVKYMYESPLLYIPTQWSYICGIVKNKTFVWWSFCKRCFKQCKKEVDSLLEISLVPTKITIKYLSSIFCDSLALTESLFVFLLELHKHMIPGVFPAKNIFRKVYVVLKRAVFGVGEEALIFCPRPFCIDDTFHSSGHGIY